MLDLYETTSDPTWLTRAISLQSKLDALHWDDVGGGYYTTAAHHETLLTRDKPSYDGAEPSGNSVATLNLLRLAELTSKDEYRKRAERCFAAFQPALSESPTASPLMLSALELYLDDIREVFIVTPKPGDETRLLQIVRTTYLPNRIFTLTTEGTELDRRAKLVPALEGKRALGGQATAFVCERGVCEQPIHSRLSRIASASVVQRQPNSPATVADRARLHPSSARADRATPRAVRSSAEKRGPASSRSASRFL